MNKLWDSFFEFGTFVRRFIFLVLWLAIQAFLWYSAFLIFSEIKQGNSLLLNVFYGLLGIVTCFVAAVNFRMWRSCQKALEGKYDSECPINAYASGLNESNSEILKEIYEPDREKLRHAIELRYQETEGIGSGHRCFYCSFLAGYLLGLKYGRTGSSSI